MRNQRWIAAALVVPIALLIPRGAEAMERSNGDVIVDYLDYH